MALWKLKALVTLSYGEHPLQSLLVFPAKRPLGPAIFKEGNDDGTNNFVLAFPNSKTAVVLLSNSSRADQMFFPLVEALFGRTCLPWFWMAYIPFDRPELRAPGTRANPVAPCGETAASAVR